MSLRKLKINTELESESEMEVAEEPILTPEEEIAAEVEIVKTESEIEETSDTMAEAEELTGQLEDKIEEIKELLQTGEKEAETTGEEPAIDPIDVAVVQENLKHLYYIAGIDKNNLTLSKEDITSNSYTSMKINLEEAEGLLNKVKGTIKNIWEKIKKFFIALWSKILSILPGKSKKAKETAKSAVSNIKIIESEPQIKKSVEEVIEVIVEESNDTNKDHDWDKLFDLAEKAAVDFVHNLDKTFLKEIDRKAADATVERLKQVDKIMKDSFGASIDRTAERLDRLNRIIEGDVEPSKETINSQCDKMSESLHYSGTLLRITNNNLKILLEESNMHQKTISDLSRFFTEMLSLSDTERIEKIFNNKPNINLYGMKYNGAKGEFDRILKTEGILQEDQDCRVIPIGVVPHLIRYESVTPKDLVEIHTDNIFIIVKRSSNDRTKDEHIKFKVHSFPGEIRSSIINYKSFENIKKVAEFLASNQLDQYVKQCKSNVDTLSTTIKNLDRKIKDDDTSGIVQSIGDVLRLLKFDYDMLLKKEVVAGFASTINY